MITSWDFSILVAKSALNRACSGRLQCDEVTHIRGRTHCCSDNAVQAHEILRSKLQNHNRLAKTIPGSTGDEVSWEEDAGKKLVSHGMTNAARVAENKPLYSIYFRVNWRCGTVVTNKKTHEDEELICMSFQKFQSPPIVFLCSS